MLLHSSPQPPIFHTRPISFFPPLIAEMTVHQGRKGKKKIERQSRDSHLPPACDNEKQGQMMKKGDDKKLYSVHGIKGGEGERVHLLCSYMCESVNYELLLHMATYLSEVNFRSSLVLIWLGRVGDRAIR